MHRGIASRSLAREEGRSAGNEQRCTLTKFARAKIIAASFFPMRCHSDRLWYAEPNAISNEIDYAKHRSRSHDAVIPVYDDAGNVIEAHEHVGEFKEW